jgi:hypothetical protein
MRSLRGGLVLPILAGLASCGGSSARPKAPGAASPFKTGVHVRITDGGQIYDALNTTDCVKWPSKDVKKRAGRDGWNDFAPNSGLEGTVVAALGHCDGKTEVVLVAIGDYVVPVTSKGVEVGDKGDASVGVIGGVVGGIDDGGYGGYGYGYGGYGYGGYDEYGGLYGGFGYGTAGFGTATSSYYVGDLVAIADTSLVYADINTTDCLQWPSDDAKTRGGSSAWGSYVPTVGEVGVILGTATHCSSGAPFLILEMDSGYVVPIEEAGVTAP